MAKSSKQKLPFQPCAEQQALQPAISGNDLNGLGEPERRRPTPIYWHEPERIPHGPLQSWMLAQTRKQVPEVDHLNAQLGGRGPKQRARRAATKSERTPEVAAEFVKAFALSHEADLVGIAKIQPEWIFEGYQSPLPTIIILGLVMEHAELAKAPAPGSVIEVMRQYNRGTRAARALADWILGQGYQAEPHGGPQAGPVLLIPPALACGFGAQGKHGSIINEQFGSSFRLAGVLTDMPLALDPPSDISVDDFCQNCQLCSNACPPDAIFKTKQMVRGTDKWYVNFDKCISYFNESYGCGICIAVCPWSRPGIAPSLTRKMHRRLKKLG